MDYLELANLIPAEKRDEVSDQLTDFILASKNDEKMPNNLANALLLEMKNRELNSYAGLTMLLEASLLLEAEKTISFFGQLQLNKIVEKIKENSA